MTDQEIQHVKETIDKKLKPYEKHILTQTTIDIAYALRECSNVNENITAFELIGYRKGFIDSLYWSARITLTDKIDITRYYEAIQRQRMEGNL